MFVICDTIELNVVDNNIYYFSTILFLTEGKLKEPNFPLLGLCFGEIMLVSKNNILIYTINVKLFSIDYRRNFFSSFL